MRYDRIAPEKITVVQNGVDADAFSAGDRARARLAIGIPEGAQVIGTMGRLSKQKGQRHLIEALALIKDTHPKAMVLIIGEGSHQAALERLAADTGVAERVRFLAVRRDIPDMLAAMDIFAMPSLWEGMSNALIEAMAAAKPIVASAIPPFVEVLTDGTDALLVPPEDSVALGSAMARLLDEPVLARSISMAARAKAVARFGIDATTARWQSLYLDILRSKGYANA